MVINAGIVHLKSDRSGRPGGEYVDPTPFLLWVDRRLKLLAAEYGAERAGEHLLSEFGWSLSHSSAVRRLHRWRVECPLVQLAEIEDALTGTAALLADLYPVAAAELDEAAA